MITHSLLTTGSRHRLCPPLFRRGATLGLALALMALVACQSSQPTPAPTTVRPTIVAPSPTPSPLEEGGGGTGSPTATALPPSPEPARATATPSPSPASAGFNPRAFKLALVPVATGLAQPLFATHAGDGSGAIYIVEKRGTIRVVSNGALRETPFLDITSIVGSQGSEQGLLGLAFHPNYPTNRQFFVNYTDLNGDTVIARYTARPDGVTADPNSARLVLKIDQPYPNHNGGMLAFGPDKMLWIGTGDGGSAGDPQGNAQNRGSLLGKMLRIDVDSGDPYGIPPDNPFINDPSTRPEIWALGLRNPWRYSFDRATGDLYIGDVGQGAWEEIDLHRAGSPGGQNYGWNIMEGGHCFRSAACDQSGLELPIAEYPTHGDGTCAVIGGYVYRGQAYPPMVGGYFYADYCGGQIWALSPAPDGAWQSTLLLDTDLSISSFGEDEAGELYITTFEGVLYRLVAAAP